MDKWQLRASETLIDDWVTIRRKSYRIGERGEDQTFVTIERPAFALAVGVDASRRILLVRQYRPGTDRSYWALPGGYLEANESPVEAARRELLEETGFASERTSHVAELHPLPAYVSSAAHIVLCEELVEQSSSSLDPEIERAEFVPMETAIQRIISGEINEMQAVAGILFVQELWRRPG